VESWDCETYRFYVRSTLALSVSVIIHPSLMARVILVIVILFIFTIFVLLPIRRCQRGFIRTAMSASGSFGVILSIALLAKAPAWSNVWERLWVSDSINWGTPQEKGLSAGFCLFLCAGAACDWFLKFRFGENPDKVLLCPVPLHSFLISQRTEMGQLSLQVCGRPSRYCRQGRIFPTSYFYVVQVVWQVVWQIA
jgi:hypothetical protein